MSPPPPISKILISSALAVLLGVSAEAITENNGEFVFTSGDSSFSGDLNIAGSKEIIFSSGLESASVNGDLNINQSGNAHFDFKGGDLAGGIGGSISYYRQSLNVSGSFVNSGVSIFDFASRESNGKLNLYEISAFSTSATGQTIFNLGSDVELHTNGVGIMSNSGKLVFNIAGGDLQFGGITTNSGGVTNFVITNGTSYSAIRSDIINKSGGKTTIDIKNTKRFSLLSRTLTNNGNASDFTISLKNSSVLVDSETAMTNIRIDLASGSELYFDGVVNTIKQLNNTSDISSFVSLGAFSENFFAKDYLIYRNDFRVLEIGTRGDKTGVAGISGNNLAFVVYANLEAKAQKIGDDGLTPLYQNNIPLIDDKKAPTIGGQALQGTYAYSDRVIIHSSQGNKGGTHNLGVVFSYWDYANLSSILYNGGDIKTEGNIAVASVANDSKVTLNPTEVVVGFNSILPSFEKISTTEQGIIDSDSNNNTYTTYFLSSARDMGVASVTQEVTSSVFALNYDLFIANFNSLNKRMGDLRNNPYSQGAWGRIFNGQLSNDFGLGSKNNYTTLQAGYDYDFGLENAKNYLGVAFSYGFSISEMSSNAKDALQSREIKDIFSNAIELALYNAYVSDSGLYSDSIAKFSYLMSDFNLTNNTTTESLSVNNYAFQLSEEVGYVFSLGGDKEWSITPQAELSFGYYSDSDLTQVAGDFYLDAKAKSMMMLRARVGSSFGYDFKRFTQDKDINASLYVGLSYEYDYLSGGDIELTPNVGQSSTTKSALSSDSRGVLNVGTNLAIKEQTRIYADIQTSFGGKITNDYQVNFGVRYSFGEKAEARGESISREQNFPLNPIKPQE